MGTHRQPCAPKSAGLHPNATTGNFTLLFFFTSAERVVISKDTAFSEMTLDVLFQLLVQVCFALQLDKSTDSPFLSSQSCTIVYTLLCD